MEKTTFSNGVVEKIDELGREYNRLTGFSITHRGVCNPREQFWHLYLKAGFTVDDLRTVVSHIRRGVQEGKRNIGALRFSNLIERIDLFEEELALAKAEKRNAKPPMTAKERVIEQIHPTVTEMRPEQATVTARPVSDLIAELKRAAGMS